MHFGRTTHDAQVFRYLGITHFVHAIYDGQVFENLVLENPGTIFLPEHFLNLVFNQLYSKPLVF